MIIASIDLETTGLRPDRHQILEFGCVLFDTGYTGPLQTMPKFQYRIYHHEIIGEPVALRMNAKLIEAMSYQDPKNFSEGWGFIDALPIAFRYWLGAKGLPSDAEGRVKLHPAGKNFGSFDSQFLKQVPGWTDKIRMTHRAFDPAVLYFRPEVDAQLPDLRTCLQRAELPEELLHEALGDALSVVALLRKKFHAPGVQEAGSVCSTS